jgi:cytochrome c-type biogenesis protein CcmH
MKYVLLLLLLFSMGGHAEEGPLKDPAQEIRAHQLFRQFRCMVCQSQSLGESDAPLARDLRGVIRAHIAAGETDQAITDYLHARYGDYILFAPPFTAGTFLLWCGPFIVLLLGGVGIVTFTRKHHHAD